MKKWGYNMVFGYKNGIFKGRVVNIDKFIKTINPTRIYLDIDGVIWHSCQAVCDVINKRFGTNVNGNEILSWNFKELGLDLTNEDIDCIFGDHYFFRCVNWINGAFSFMCKYNDKITIVTKGTHWNLTRKLDIFNELNLNIVMCGLPLDKSKGDINMQGGLLIDDCTKNLKESNATYKIQFLEYDDNKNNIREWTKDWNGLKMYKW